MSAQTNTVASVARRGYLDGYTDGELFTRQVVKLAEELGELVDYIETPDSELQQLFYEAGRVAERARIIFDNPQVIDATINDTQAAIAELTDLQVVIHVAAHALHVPDIAYAAQVKALADEARGVRNGDQRP